MRVPSPSLVLPVIVAGLCLPAPAASQQVPVVQLGKPAAEFTEPFDQVTAVRELSDGRVVVADLFARSVSLVDFRTGQAAAIGREGQGPKEFAFPAGLVPLPGDTTWITDLAQRRFLQVAPDGTPLGTIPFPDEIAGMGRVKGADAMGRIYVQGSPFGGDGPPRDPSELPDSAPVLRWDRTRKSVTPVGKVKLATSAMSSSGSAGARNVMIRQQPFSAADDWAVTSAGRVGFVRVGSYHMDWSAPAPRAGAAVAFTPVPVTGADKKELADRQKDQRGALMIARGGPPRSGAASPPPPAPPPLDWPAAKPPFVAGSAIASPEGEIWVERSQPAGAPELIDVFDPAGKLVRQVRMPPATRLVAVGVKGIYAARTDDEGLWYLQRYPK